MDQSSAAAANSIAARQSKTSTALLRSIVIGLAAFLTVVDLFAAQALLPSLVARYHVSPAAMGVAVNACTFGMAAAGLAVALFGRRLDHRNGILISLIALSIPTALLAIAPNLTAFAALRVVQGIFMATAFSLTLAHLGERFDAQEAAGAFAAYITGNVASNLIGRLIAAAVTDHAGLSAAFYVFATLNLVGAVLIYFTVHRVDQMMGSCPIDRDPSRSAWLEHLQNPALRAAFAIGFCILFAFIGTFTFINFVLVKPPLAVGMMQLGFVYFVFLPSIFTTPLAGAAALRFGTRQALLAGLFVAGAGLPLLLSAHLVIVLAGMALVAVGTFFAQALATGFVSKTATRDRGAASGIYLASYFLGGLVGTAVLGHVFDQFGWAATVAGIAAVLVCAALLSGRLIPAAAQPHSADSMP